LPVTQTIIYNKLTCRDLISCARWYAFSVARQMFDSTSEDLNSVFTWKSSHRLSRFRRNNISNGSPWGKGFVSAGSRPDIRSRNTGRAITIYFSSALLFGIHIMLKMYWIAQSVQSPGYFMPQWSHVPFQSCNSVPGFALFSKSLLTLHLNVLFLSMIPFCQPAINAHTTLSQPQLLTPHLTIQISGTQQFTK